MGERREWVLINDPHVEWHIVQETNSSLLLHVIALPELTDSEHVQTLNITVEHVGKGCRTEIYGMGLLGGKQRCDIITRVLHTVGGGYSSQLIKMVLGGSAKATFKGELKILSNAQQVEAYQTNRNILLSHQADMITEPQLEIYADDVKCSHGATIGRLNEEEQFYMCSRGITLEDAMVLQMISFLAPVLEAVPETDREALSSQIESAIRNL